MDIDDIFNEYMDFFIGFAANPRKALKPYAGKRSINKKLRLFVAEGIIISLVISSGAVPADDKGTFISLIRSFSPEQLPIVALFIILISAIILHIFAELWLRIDRSLNNPTIEHVILGGSIYDSINASFAFGAFFIPVATFTFSILNLFIKWYPNNNLVFLVFSILLNILFFYYFVSALGATHLNTSSWQVCGVFCGAIILIYFVIKVVMYVSL